MKFKLNDKQRKYLSEAFKDMVVPVIDADNLYDYLDFLCDEVISKENILKACKLFGCRVLEASGRRFVAHPEYKGTEEEFRFECFKLMGGSND